MLEKKLKVEDEEGEPPFLALLFSTSRTFVVLMVENVSPIMSYGIIRAKTCANVAVSLDEVLVMCATLAFSASTH